MAYDGVQYLDSQKLLDAAKMLDQCLKDYKDTLKNVSRVSSDLLNSWHGEGRNAFEKDYVTIYQQLSDIGDLMYNLYDALVDADATYIQADEDLAKQFTMEA